MIHPTSPFAVLWDLDGVLVDSAPYHQRAWEETFAEEGVRLDEACFRHTFGWRNDAIVAYVMGPEVSPERSAAIGEVKESRYRALVAREGISPLPGTMEWLNRLHGRGVPQAIVSSAPLSNVSAVLAALGFTHLFQAIVSAEDVRRGKPDPEVFLLAARRLGMSPQRCIVVEDAPAGVEGARRAGMRCLALGTTHPHQDLSAADLVVDSLSNLAPDAFDHLLAVWRVTSRRPLRL